MAPLSSYWTLPKKEYQVYMQVIDGPNEPEIDFPLVLQPADKEESLASTIGEISKIAPQPSDEDEKSTIRKLLDNNGGAIHIKALPLRSAKDFSEFVSALAGQGKHAWKPHVPAGLDDLPRSQAENVYISNEGPSSYFIGWQNEQAPSPLPPAYLILFCRTPAASGGETSLVNSIALHDRLAKQIPQFIKAYAEKGQVYTIPHSLAQKSKINSLISDTDTVEERKKAVQERVQELARTEGWHEGIDRSDESLPVWKRRGWDVVWKENGEFEVVYRIRMHPTLGKEAIFNAISTSSTLASVHNTFAPPFKYTNKDGSTGVAVPPHFAGLSQDEVIPHEWLATMDAWQHRLESSVALEQGDVLIVDNLAVQHGRWAFSGEREVLVSFWDQPGLTADASAL